MRAREGHDPTVATAGRPLPAGGRCARAAVLNVSYCSDADSVIWKLRPGMVNHNGVPPPV